MNLEPRLVPPFYNDPFDPILFTKVTPAVTTEEQDALITEILSTCSSDSKFAEKAFRAIKLVLAGGSLTAVPVLESIDPTTKPVASPPFTLTCTGTGFDATCVIYANGNALPTTFVSETSLTTQIDLTSVTNPTTIPVMVRNGMGVSSLSVTLTVTSV